MGQLFFNYIVPRLDIKVFICTCTHTKNYKKHQLQQSSECHLSCKLHSLSENIHVRRD